MLGEIFNAIHRADLGGAAQKLDPQLPHKVRLPAPAAPSAPAAGSSGAALAPAAAEGRPQANGVPAQEPAGPESLVQHLFGLEVQVELASSPHLLASRANRTQHVQPLHDCCWVRIQISVYTSI